MDIAAIIGVDICFVGEEAIDGIECLESVGLRHKGLEKWWAARSSRG